MQTLAPKLLDIYRTKATLERYRVAIPVGTCHAPISADNACWPALPKPAYDSLRSTTAAGINTNGTDVPPRQLRNHRRPHRRPARRPRGARITG